MSSSLTKTFYSLGLLNVFLITSYACNLLGFGYILGYALIAVLILNVQFIKDNLDLNFFILTVYCISYGIAYSFNPVDGLQLIMVYLLTPPFLYLWGKYFVTRLKNRTQIYLFLIFLGLATSIPGILSVTANLLEGGFDQATRTITYFWTDEPISATGMAAMFVLNMCIPAILLTSDVTLSRLYKIILVAIYILSLFCIIRLGSRTQLVISLITFLIGIILLVPKQSLRKNISLFILLVIAIFLVFRNVSFDWDADWLSSFAGRMDNRAGNDIATGGGRTERWINSIENIIDKPFGWSLSEFGYSHNLWLDVSRVGGVISMTLLLIFTIRSYFTIRTAIKVNRDIFAFQILIVSYAISFFLLFMVEPVVEGSFYLLVLFCLFLGIVKKSSTYFSE